MTKADVQNANAVKQLVLESLVAEGYLTKEKANYFSTNYAVILSNRDWFRRIYDKLFKHRKPDEVYYDMVKIVLAANIDDVENNEEEETESLSELQFQLIKAEKEDNFELAQKLKKQIEILEKKKK